MSKNKRLLRNLRLFIIINSCASVLLFLISNINILKPELMFYPQQIVFLSAFPVFFASIILANEFSSEFRGSSNSKFTIGLKFEELKYIAFWVKGWEKALIIICVACINITHYILYGSTRTHWSGGMQYTSQHISGFTSGSLIFYGMSYIAISSAYKMPGSYSDNFKSGVFISDEK